MYAILALCLIGGILCGAHFVAAAIEMAAIRRQSKREEAAQAIADAQQYSETARVLVVDQKHSPRQPHAFDVQDLFRTGRH